MDRRDDELVGRADELGVLARAVGRARDGIPTAVLVVGEAGMGKTHVVRAALGREDVTVVTAVGDDAESDLDYGVMDQLLRNTALEPQVGDLLASPGADPLKVGAALLRTLDGLQLSRPLAVVIDDAHWADRASLDALTFTARRLRADQVVCVLACRPEGVDRLPRGLLRLVETTGGRIDLRGLDAAAVRELAVRLVEQPVSAVAAERLREHTAGNPLHVGTLLRELPVEALDGAGPLPAPRSYATLVLARLAACGDDAQRLVAALAVLGARAPLATAAAVAGLEDPLAALDEAVEQRLVEVVVRPGERSVAFTHPLIRAAVVDDLPPSRLAALHRAAGEVSTGPAALRHRLAGCAGYDAGLAAEAERVATAEADRGAHSSSARLWMEVARVAPTATARGEAVLTAIDQLLLAGDLVGARARRHAVEALPDSPRRSFLRGRLAYVLGPRPEARALLERAWAEATGEAAPAVATPAGGAAAGATPSGATPAGGAAAGGAPGEDATAEGAAGEATPAEATPAGGAAAGATPAGGRLAPPDPVLAGRIAALLATVAVDRADGADGALWARRSMELAAGAAADCNDGHMLAMSRALQSRVADGIAELDAALADPPSQPAAVSDLRLGRGVLRLWAHDLRGGAEDLKACLGAWGAGGSLVNRETARFYLAELHYRAGRWDDAIVTAEAAASIADGSDQVWLAAFSHCVAVYPLAARGEWERAEAHLADAQAAADESGGGAGALWVFLATLRLAEAREDHGTVVGLGDLMRRARGRLPIDEGIAVFRAAYVEALAAAGRVDDAGSVAEWLAESGEASVSPFARAEVARARLVVAAARGDDAGVDAAAAAGLSDHPEAPGPFARAQLELAAGRAWRRRGDRARADEVLEAARGRFARLGATPWLDRLDRELAPARRRQATSAPAGAVTLTEQERAVTHLVAQGMTNREVADELILSVKTVEHHLSKAYAKLGVRSRTELVRVLVPTDGERP